MAGSGPKPVVFRATALDDLRAFPLSARREAGHQIDQVQHGGDPDDWKPIQSVGKGVREIRVRDEAGAFRVLYVAKFGVRFTCCIASGRRHKRPARAIWS